MRTKYPLSVGITIVIANMIGTGVFTSLGYQVGPLPSPFVILLLWLLGGVVALCGALTYAEIATTLKRSGGEYLYLSELWHPAVGFISGWMSTIAGFGGAIAAVAIAIGAYSSSLTAIPEQVISLSCIAVITGIHLLGVKAGGTTQTILTTLKLSLIIFFCIAPFFAGGTRQPISFLPQEGDWNLALSPAFAVGLVFVVYAYTGWNAAAYISGNLENPVRNLPRALLTGTLVVVLAYLALNAMFMRVSSFSELQGQNDVGNVVALGLFGPTVGKVFAFLFSFALLSTLSAMTIAGPRVAEAMGEDYTAIRKLSVKNRFEMPYVAILVQAGWSMVLVLVSSFERTIQYISVSLSFFSMLTVAGIFILRKRYNNRPYKVPLYPIPPIIFIVVTTWMIYYTFQDDPLVIALSLGTMIPGLIIYQLVRKSKSREGFAEL